MAQRGTPLWPDRTVKPPFGAAEIDLGSRFGPRILCFLAFNERAGSIVDLVTLRAAPPENGPVWNRVGPSLTAASSQRYGFGVTLPINGRNGTPTTWAFRLKASAAGVLFGKSDANNDSGWVIEQISTTGIKITGVCSSGNGASLVTAASGAWHSVCIAWDTINSNQTTGVQVVDGAVVTPVSQTNGTGSVVSDADDAFYVGYNQYATSGSTYGNAEYDYFVIFNGKLSAAEMMAFQADPWSALKPIVRRRYAKVAAAPSGFKPAWAIRRQRTIGAGVI